MKVTQGLSKALHKSAPTAFLHTTANAPKPGRGIQNSWYDEDAKYQFTRETIDVYNCGIYNDGMQG